MGSFADEIQKKLAMFKKDLALAQKTAARKALRAGINEYKRISKPYIPKLSADTRFRRAGALQRKLKVSVKLDRDKIGGKASLFFSNKGSKPVMLKRKRIGITQDGKKLTGSVKAYRNDPFYWFMVDQGTSKMGGRFYRNKMKSIGQTPAEEKALKIYKNTMKAEMKRWK